MGQNCLIQKKDCHFSQSNSPTFTKQLRKNYTIITDYVVLQFHHWNLNTMQSYVLFLNNQNFLYKKSVQFVLNSTY